MDEHELRRSLTKCVAGLESGNIGKKLRYSELKGLLGTLKSPDDPDQTYEMLRRAFEGKNELLDDSVNRLAFLSNKEIRKTIEEDRRERGNGHWYGNDDDDDDDDDDEGTDGENQATELIATVDIIYYLIFGAKVSARRFPQLLGLKVACVFGLAKLISAFTGDFKILEIYLEHSEQSGALLADMIEYLPVIAEGWRYSETEVKNFRAIIIARVELQTLLEALNGVSDAFQERTLSLASSSQKQLLSKIILAEIACTHFDDLRKRIDLRSADIQQFLSTRNAEPFVLTMLERTVECGAEALVRAEKRHRAMLTDDGKLLDSDERALENSVKVIKYLLPVLRIFKDAHMYRFDVRDLRDQIDRIQAPKHDKYFAKISSPDRDIQRTLGAYLDEISQH